VPAEGSEDSRKVKTSARGADWSGGAKRELELDRRGRGKPNEPVLLRTEHEVCESEPGGISFEI
jgi:hypothetical protein